MARLTFLILRATPVVFLIGAAMSVAIAVFSLMFIEELTTDEVGDIVFECLSDAAFSLTLMTFAYWFRRLVEKEFPEVRA